MFINPIDMCSINNLHLKEFYLRRTYGINRILCKQPHLSALTKFIVSVKKAYFGTLNLRKLISQKSGESNGKISLTPNSELETNNLPNDEKSKSVVGIKWGRIFSGQMNFLLSLGDSNAS